MKIKFRSFLKKEYLILCVLIILGAFLRLQGVFTNSFAFTYDVGRDMLALWDIAYNHKIVLIGATTGIPGVFYGPWWYYMLTPFFFLFKGSPQGIAFILSSAGILSIFISYYVGKRIGSVFLGILMALFTSLSPSMIDLSSQIWNPNIAPVFALLVFLILERIYVLKNKAKLSYFFILGTLLALNIDIEILWGILFSLGIIISLLIVLRKNLTLKKFVFIALGVLMIISPRIIFELRHNFIMNKSLLAFFSTKNLEDKLDLYHFLENRFFTHLGEFSKSFMYENNYLITFLLVTAIVSILLFYKNTTRIIKDFILTLFIVLLVFYSGTLIFGRALWSHYLVGLPVIYIFLFSISVFLLRKKLQNLFIPSVIILLVLVFGLHPKVLIEKFTNAHWEGNAAVYRNQLSVVDYVYQQSNGKDFKYVVYTPPVHDYTYRYLFKWYGQSKYNYFPNEEARTAYFIIEPDLDYPDRPKWWLEARVKDGQIIKSQVLKGGIVVQTRVH